MQPNEPDKDALVLGSLLNARAIDAVLGGSQAAKQRLLSWQVKNRITVFEFETVTVNAQGQELTRCCQQASSYREYLLQQVCIEMVAIPGGHRCPIFYEQISDHSSSVDSARSPSSYQASIALKSVLFPG